jgi:myosin heavy subunit
MFHMEQEEYIKENIVWQNIKFQDNQHTIDLIEHSKNTSIFRLLDEQFMLQASGNDSNFLKNCNTMLSTNKSYKRPDKLGAK